MAASSCSHSADIISDAPAFHTFCPYAYPDYKYIMPGESMVLPLSQIETGKPVKIVWVASPPDMAARLYALGFIPDEEVCCVLSGRPGGMRAYLVRGAVIALRHQNSCEIFVET